MAVTVASRRKRGPDAFLDEPIAFPSDLSPLAKRGRCSTSAVADLELSFPLEFDPIEALRLIFPNADPQVLREYYEASGNVLDAAITAFKDHMANRNTESASPLNYAPPGNRTNLITSSEVAPAVNIPTNGSEWAELIVKEMSSASDLVDAKKRAFGMLELFQKSTVGSDSKSIQEHKVVKQMLGSLLHQNGVLKRAFLIQHNRLKEYEEMAQERSQFKQLIEKYQEQIKALEDKNYFLSFHLQQANQHRSISSHRNPDVY
ncbi:hypothetical protein PR202_ga14850 [Eleusine coracana subsp. coracana]|uniref:CUE domain-containing protein n=1 Tax=Eleusine coracana subsp. coracana TaxID=191504 RepID=A0AAV5CIB2_ELECO|nr:hypothetical protein PR202_ga14850 [Eleusine coracana subsp. coracana]